MLVVIYMQDASGTNEVNTSPFLFVELSTYESTKNTISVTSGGCVKHYNSHISEPLHLLKYQKKCTLLVHA